MSRRSRSHRFYRLSIGLVLLALALGSVTGAQAHAYLLRSDPADNSALDEFSSRSKTLVQPGIISPLQHCPAPGYKR